jgi:hypothetical protein
MSQIPDLIKIGSIPGDMEMSVDTDILEPVVQSNSFCRFTLINKGFMNSFSKIILGMDALATNGSFNTYPVNVGISALVERATLKVGAKTISETEDFGHFMGYKSLFIDPSINKQREQVISGRGTALALRYQNASGNFSEFNASSYGLDNGICYIQNGRAPADEQRSGLLPHIWQELAEAPEFQVSLADLFPFLRYNSLPLYMFDEQISVELHFRTSSDERMVGPSGDTTTNISTNAVKLIADYIYYDGEIMEQFANANRDMNFQYVDYQLNKRTLTKTQAETKQIMNVGGAGRIVSKMFGAMYNDTADITSVLNIYNAESPLITVVNGARQMGILTSNVRYNDKYLYPLDRVSNAIHFHDITSTEASPPNVSRDMYSGGGEGLTAEEYNGQRQDTNMKGQFYWQAHRFNRNERINSRGIEYEQKYSAIADQTFTCRMWLEVIKQAQLRNGILDINFA